MSDPAPAYRDRQPAPVAPEGETVLASFAPDRGRYIQDHLTIAAIGGVVAVIVLLVLGKGDQIWAGIVGVMAAMLLRGAWLYSDVMAMRWLLTDRALIAPGQARYDLADIARLRILMGDVQVTTHGGRKTLIKHLADPQAAITRIEAAR